MINKNNKNEQYPDYLSLTNDYVFKKVFGSMGNENITKNLLESALNIKINDINLNENPFTEKDLMSDKLGILDIKATLNNNIPCDVEMQVVSYNYLDKRILFYWSKLFTSSQNSIKSGESFEKLNKTISVFFVDFPIEEIIPSLKGVTDFHTQFHIYEDHHLDCIFSDVLEIHIISLNVLENLDNLVYNKDEMNLINWIKFIKNPNLSEESIMENKYIQEAKKQVDKINSDYRERELAESRMKYIMEMNSIKASGYEDGVKDGSKKEKIEIAKNMLKSNYSIDEITKLTGLSQEEIESLK